MQPQPEAETLLALYGERINAHDFDLLEPLISPAATFWFSEGSFSGPAIRAAFERTWAQVAEETYWLEDVEWIAGDDEGAACIYGFRWRGLIAGQPAAGGGRGTSVLRREADGWKIVHEHLSPLPRNPAPQA